MRRLMLTLALLFAAVAFPCAPALAQEASADGDRTFRAFVLEVVDERTERRENGSVSVSQVLRLEGLSGEWEGREVLFDGTAHDVLSAVAYRPGDKVYVLASSGPDGEDVYYVTGRARSGALLLLTLLFAAVVIAIGRAKGLRALIVLALSLVVILKLVVPRLVAGDSALGVGLLGCAAVVLLAIYATEGWRRESHVAAAAVALALLATAALSWLFVDAVALTGFESEDVMYLVSSAGTAVNVRGLLLIGIVIGTLGVLDDVVISQVAVVRELREADPGLTPRETRRRAMKVGVSHLSSMVNTLFLAYAGASLPLLMLLSMNQFAPLGFAQAVSDEMVATEIVRAAVGSIGLVLAVPIATLLAVRFGRAGK